VRGSFKGNVWPIVKAHRASYVDASTGRSRWQDQLAFEAAPFVAAVLLFAFDVKLRVEASVGLLTISGLLSAFLFGVMLQVSERAVDWADSHSEPSQDTSDHAAYLEELSANAGYASLVCIAAAVAYVVASTTAHHPWPLRISSAIGLALGIHMVLTLFMVMRRVFALTQQRLNRARTGAGGRASSLPERRRGAA
jgi:hypothetical protein